jgi:hypothetical protein
MVSDQSIAFKLQLVLILDRSDLSAKERIAYTDAVRCFQAKPPITDPAFAPGAKSRFDDFIVTHMNQTFSIHTTVSSSIETYNSVFRISELTLLLFRATSSHGIDITYLHMIKHFERNVDIRGSNRTGTGANMLCKTFPPKHFPVAIYLTNVNTVTRFIPLSSMAVLPA